MDDTTRLWKVWWIWGVPVAGLTGALVWFAGWAYWAGYPALEDLLGAARIMLYWFWFHAAWKCSRNVDHPLWTYLARTALLGGLLITAVLY